MIRNICKEDVGMLSELLGKTLDAEVIDYELSMLDDVDGEIRSAFVVGVYRVPYEMGASEDDEFFFHEVLGYYSGDEDDESLNRAFHESCAATNKLIYFWIPWTKENEERMAPAFIENTCYNIRHLYTIVLSGNLKSKYKGK